MPRQPALPLLRIAMLVAIVAGGAVAVPAAATDPVVVKRGDTLSEIAARHGMTLAQLIALNAIANPNRIYPGQRLRLEADPPAVSEPPAVPAAATPIIHVVKAGEHLTGIAQRYGTTIAAIVQANNIAKPSFLRVGQRLTIPAAAAPAQGSSPAAPAAATPIIHVVKAGEHLTGIAQRYGTTIAAIVQANSIAKPSFLRVGQRLTIPGGTAPVAVPGAAQAPLPAAVAARAAIGAIIAAEAQAQGVPIAFALAVAWQESGWQADAVSRAGAVGVMQITPPTADWIAASLTGHAIHLHDAASNIHAGIALLRHYLDRYHGDKILVLAAYYQGQTAADRYGVFRITRSYVSSVLGLESSFSH
ncbi:MAG: LysM peptidoglycan-binding domain-containing protein [Chloroflexota bacterium]|nr:LysM peptidoglycan-binding domain-containing protein [Chloroflexota bacterium]